MMGFVKLFAFFAVVEQLIICLILRGRRPIVHVPVGSTAGEDGWREDGWRGVKKEERERRLVEEEESVVEMRRRREQALSSTRREQGEQTVAWMEVVVRTQLSFSQSFSQSLSHSVFHPF